MKKLDKREKELLRAFLAGFSFHQAAGNIDPTGLALFFSDYLNGYGNKPIRDMSEIIERLINPVVKHRENMMMDEADSSSKH